MATQFQEAPAQAAPAFNLTRYLNQLVSSAHLLRIELAAVTLAAEIGADDFEGWGIYNNPLPGVLRDFVIEHTYAQWRLDGCEDDPTERDLLAVEAAWRVAYLAQAQAFDEAVAVEVAA